MHDLATWLRAQAQLADACGGPHVTVDRGQQAALLQLAAAAVEMADNPVRLRDRSAIAALRAATRRLRASTTGQPCRDDSAATRLRRVRPQ